MVQESQNENRAILLDGLRGIAAIIVMLHHVWPIVTGDFLWRRGHLAVDFFFMLSGCVITLAYDARFKAGLTASGFLKARIRRLYPAIAIGIVLGAVFAITRGMAPIDALSMLVVNLLFLPVLASGVGYIFPLNPVQWSLLFEFVANFIHVRILHDMNRKATVFILGLTLCLFIGVVWHFETVGIGDRGNNFFAGLPRVIFSYLVGIVVARLYWAGKMSRLVMLGKPAIGALLLVSFGAGTVVPDWDGWWIDAGIVILLFPPILAWGLASKPGPLTAKAARAAGALSYPLYAVHVPAAGLTVFLLRHQFGHGGLIVSAVIASVAGGLAVHWLTAGRRSAQPGRIGFGIGIDRPVEAGRAESGVAGDMLGQDCPRTA